MIITEDSSDTGMISLYFLVNVILEYTFSQGVHWMIFTRWVFFNLHFLIPWLLCISVVVFVEFLWSFHDSVSSNMTLYFCTDWSIWEIGSWSWRYSCGYCWRLCGFCKLLNFFSKTSLYIHFELDRFQNTWGLFNYNLYVS